MPQENSNHSPLRRLFSNYWNTSNFSQPFSFGSGIECEKKEIFKKPIELYQILDKCMSVEAILVLEIVSGII